MEQTMQRALQRNAFWIGSLLLLGITGCSGSGILQDDPKISEVARDAVIRTEVVNYPLKYLAERIVHHLCPDDCILSHFGCLRITLQDPAARAAGDSKQQKGTDPDSVALQGSLHGLLHPLNSSCE